MAEKEGSDAVGRSVNEQGLRAQAGLLGFGLLAFGVSLPLFVWAGGHATNSTWMSASFVLFAVGWGCFYAIVNWLKTPAAADPVRRGRVHILGGLIWAGAIAQVSVFSENSGPARDILLLLTLAGAMVTVVFAAPWLPSLLIVAPAALAGPLIALFLAHGDPAIARLALAAAALSLALGLMVNVILRRQFALMAEREVLIAERAEQAEAARRLARSKSDLVSTLSDEIRNSLTGVAHVLESAKTSRSAPSRQQLGAALDAVNDLLAVLDTTVDAETAEAGRLAIDPRPMDVAALARDLVRQQRPAAATRGLEMALHVDPAIGPGAAVADPVRVRQALAALVGNAVKFTVRGRVDVRIARAGERIAVSVADTGPGLTEEELAAALKPFRRIARTSSGAPGAGLGLPFALQLAQLMGGDLRAESVAGVGSSFTLELPFDPEASLPLEAAAASPDRRRLRVLAVEPDALDAAMLRASLEQLGHQVVHAVDGVRGVELARVCDFDLAVISAGPGGAETLAALRALPGAAGRTPTMAVIGGDPEEAAACQAAGAGALLRKPVAVPACARAIAEALAVKSPANDRAVA